MTEKDELKKAKGNYKASVKNKRLYDSQRDHLLSKMMGKPTPKWGGLKITVLNN